MARHINRVLKTVLFLNLYSGQYLYKPCTLKLLITIDCDQDVICSEDEEEDEGYLFAGHGEWM
jgi:hypothetical protein